MSSLRFGPDFRDDGAGPGGPDRLGLRAALCLFLVAALSWWPLDGYAQSDDFIAMHWAQSADRVFGDFVGPQYDVSGAINFYRPIVTLAFGFDALVASTLSSLGVPGAAGIDERTLSAMVSLGLNALIHACSTVLLGMIVCRCFVTRSRLTGFSAGLVWTLLPCHEGALQWAVGRTGPLATVFALLAILHAAQFAEKPGRRPLLWVGAAALVSMMAKEVGVSAVPLSAGVALLVASRSRGIRSGALASLTVLGFGVGATIVYAAARRYALGIFLGGYGGGLPDPWTAVRGALDATQTVISPLAAPGVDALTDGIGPQLAFAAGTATVALALALLVRRREFTTILCSVSFFVLALLPSYPLWPTLRDDWQTIRYLYLPTTALVVLLARAGWLPTLLWVAMGAIGILGVRTAQQATYASNRALHTALIGIDHDLRQSTDETSAPLFVSGIPRAGVDRVGLGLYLGIDRLLKQPFTAHRQSRALFALRPLDGSPVSRTIEAGDTEGIPLPHCPTFGFTDPTIVARLPNPSRTRIRVRAGTSTPGQDPTDFSTATLQALAAGETDRFLEIEGAPEAATYRLTLFTPGGYLSSVTTSVQPQGPDTSHKRLDLAAFFTTARYALGPDIPDGRYVLTALEKAVSIDLESTYPLLVEAGTQRAVPGSQALVFQSTHTAAQWVELTFDRGLSGFLNP